jgi:hypothetical protein
VAHAVQQHSQVRHIFIRYDNPTLKTNACKLVDAEFEKHETKASGGARSTSVATAAKHNYLISNIEFIFSKKNSNHLLEMMISQLLNVALAKLLKHQSNCIRVRRESTMMLIKN